MTVYVVQPLSLWPEAKARYILDRMVEHEIAWNDYQVARRDITLAWLMNPMNVFFEVWEANQDKTQPAGILTFSDIVFGIEAQGHFQFFDGKLRGKEQVLRQSMEWAFRNLHIHRLAAQIPADAAALISFARERLGFRFEAERRSMEELKDVIPLADRAEAKRNNYRVRPSPRIAAQGSRKYQAVRRHGEWLDLMLLSVTQPEFEAFLETVDGSASPAARDTTREHVTGGSPRGIVPE